MSTPSQVVEASSVKLCSRWSKQVKNASNGVSSSSKESICHEILQRTELAQLLLLQGSCFLHET